MKNFHTNSDLVGYETYRPKVTLKLEHIVTALSMFGVLWSFVTIFMLFGA